MFEWDKEKALALLEAYKKFWGPSKNPEYGITGKPDASTGKTNSKSVYQTVKNHGYTAKGRASQGAFVGAGAILENLEEIIEEEVFLEDDLDDIEQLSKLLNTLETKKDRNPRNIKFRTVISFEKPKGEDDEPKIKRGFVRGHFLTPAYWEFRQWKAKKDGASFPSKKPDPKWTALPKGSGDGPIGIAEPPLWQAIFSKENSLRKLIDDIKVLMEKQQPEEVSIDINANLGPNSAEALSNISGVQRAIKEVMGNANIYARNSMVVIKDRLNQAISQKQISVNPADLQILSQNCTLTVKGEKVELQEIVNYEQITSLQIKFPKNNKALNRLIRAVMGEEMNTYDLSSLTGWEGSAGITLKQLDAIKAASNLMKVLK
jgi:hypothetical protein